MMRNPWMTVSIFLGLLSFSAFSYGDRIKDLVDIAGVRDNQLVGYGLVVGLNGTGDRSTQAPFTNQSIRNMLTELGVRIPNNTNFRLQNVAAVAISAKLPPFTKIGQTIDITVSSIGNASSLRGGVLLMSPLKGIDGTTYAIAQGNLVVSGLGAQGADGSKITVNIPSVGRIPNGAIIERAVPSPFLKGETVTFQLKRPDFTTANRIANMINETFKVPNGAVAIDAGTVEIDTKELLPPTSKFDRNSEGNITALISELENLTVQPGEAAARIVVNARTGTVVIGRHVRVSPAVVSHGNLSVVISENPYVSQPNSFSRNSRARTREVQRSDISVEQERNRAFLFNPGGSLNDIVNAVNQVGAAPSDLVAILESLKSVGAIRAELIVI